MNIPSRFVFVPCSESEFNRMLNSDSHVTWAEGKPCALYDDFLGFPIAFYIEDMDSPNHSLHYFKRSFLNV